jgi:hypothetical protein
MTYWTKVVTHKMGQKLKVSGLNTEVI